MWELSLAPLLQAVASRIDHPTEAKPPLVIHRVPLDADSAKLVFFRNAIGNFIPTKTLEPPLLLKLGDFVGSYYPEIEVTEEVSQILRNVLDEGEELTTSEAVKRLRSEGHDVRKRSEWFHGNRYYPIPFNGFKEYYATQPTDGPVVPTSKTRVEQDSASDSSLVEAIGTIELGSS
jgi:hypothetical protein